MKFKSTAYFLFLAIAELSALPAFGGGSAVTYGRKHVALAPDFQRPMQCVLDQLKQSRYNPKDVGCFGYRPGNASAHPTGHACDVDQTGRNRTSLNKSMSSGNQKQLAIGCHAVSGCKWKHPDCGHFESFSAPYSRAGTPAGSHYYGPKYASHPLRRRRQR